MVWARHGAWCLPASVGPAWFPHHWLALVVTCPDSGCALLSWHHQVCGWLSAGESQPLPGPCRRCPYHPHQPCERKPSSGVIKSASKKGSKGCLGARIRRCTRTDGQGRRTGAEALRATGNLWRCERAVFPSLCTGDWEQGEVTNRDAAQDGWRSGLQTLWIFYIENSSLNILVLSTNLNLIFK